MLQKYGFSDAHIVSTTFDVNFALYLEMDSPDHETAFPYK
jgi:hypothetical protein